MTTPIINNLKNSSVKIEQTTSSGRYSYYQVSEATKLKHPGLARIIEAVYSIANLLLQGVNYLHSRIWSQPLEEKKVHTIEKVTTREQGTSLPIQQPPEELLSETSPHNTSFEPIQIDDDEDDDELTKIEEEVKTREPAPETTAVNTETALAVIPTFTNDEMRLFQAWHVLNLVNAYMQKMQKQGITPTEEELKRVFSEEKIQKIHEEISHSIRLFNPAQIDRIKHMIHVSKETAEKASEEEKTPASHDPTALYLGYGIATGIGLTAMNYFLGHYLSHAGFETAKHAYSSLKSCLGLNQLFARAPLLKGIAKHTLSLAAGGLHRYAIASKVINAIGLMSLFFLPMRKAALSMMQKPGNSQEKLEDATLASVSSAAIGCLGYLTAKEIKRYIHDMNHALASEGTYIMRKGLNKVTGLIKDASLNHLLPSDKLSEEKKQFERGYTTAATAATTYFLGSALAGPWIAAPMSLLAGAGALMATRS